MIIHGNPIAIVTNEIMKENARQQMRANESDDLQDELVREQIRNQRLINELLEAQIENLKK